MNGGMTAAPSRALTALATAAVAAGAALFSPPPARAQEGPDADASVLPDGAYASRWRVSSRAQLRPENRYVRTITTSLLLHHVIHDEGRTRVSSRYCSVVQAPLGRVRTTLGPAFVASIPEWEEFATVRGPADGPWTFELPLHEQVLGARLSDPGEPLPTEGDDPRVVDSDGDGHPGFTTEVAGFVDGQVYMVQRLSRGLRGTLDPSGHMTGQVLGTGQQEVVGASNTILKTFTPRFEHDPDPSRSTFTWAPAPANATCTDIVAAESELFGED